ncbi:ankyrin repeat-containing domain protein [Flagelloscypha sp. PMI_526]|nr:ankyrin repeat-containing domain protein [Flagelloscypha sp. PMI_526]
MASHKDQLEDGKGLRAIAFDGSFNPAQALSELLILEDVGARWAWDTGQDQENVHPSEMFDIICGTGIGGFYAVLFASLNLTIGQAIQVHQLLNDMLFNSTAWLKKDQEGCRATALKTLERMVEELDVKTPLDQMFTERAFTKAFICVVNSSSAGCYRVLRNFRCRLRSPSCTIKEALLVCLSDSVHIPSMRIQSESFLSGVNGFANPMRILMEELENAFPKSSEMACLINVGAGHPGALPLPNEENLEETAALLRSCEHVAEGVSAQCHDLGSFFFRLSVPTSIHQSQSDNSDFISLVMGLTAGYLKTAEATLQIDCLVDTLKERNGVLSLKRLCSFAGEDGQSQISAKVAGVQQHLDNTIFRDVNAWLQPIHQTSKLDSNIRARGETTCRWLLVNAVFMRWIEKGGLFWFHGLMGTGKTVMSSFIIQALLARNDIYVAYYYFEFTNSVTLSEEALLRSLVSQLAGISPTITRSLHQKHNNGGTQPQLETLQAALNELLSISSKPVFIVIDALDELSFHKRKYVLESLLTLCASRGSFRTHLMVTSREEVDILRMFEGKIDFELSVQGDLVRQDIAAFVNRQLEAEKWKRWPRDEVEIMRRLLNERANGQLVHDSSQFRAPLDTKLLRFRMVACQVDILQRVKNSRQLRESLSSLPNSLGETYSRVVERIPAEDRELAHRLFAILSFASGRISIAEISAMLAVELSSDDGSNDPPQFQEANLFHDPLDVVDLGTCLVSRVASSNGPVLQLAHASVKEYLLASSSSWSPLNEDLAHHVIASAALALLLHFQVLQQDASGPNIYEYSLHKWYTHVLPNGPPQLLQQQRLLYASFPWHHRMYRTPSSMLHSVVFLGLFDLFQELLVSYKWGSETLKGALIWGARSHHQQHNIQCCRLLLSHRAEANLFTDKSAALRTAASLNNIALSSSSLRWEQISLKVLRYPIENGVDVNTIGGAHGTALQAASSVNALEVIQCLVENGADMNPPRGKDRTPGLPALSWCSTEAIQYLIEKGANVSGIGKYYGTVLQVAVVVSPLEIVQFLVEKGADVNKPGGKYGTALQAAAAKRSIEIVQYLIDMGADVNKTGGKYGTALQAAASKGSIEIVQYLIDTGADVNKPGGKHGTALGAAVDSSSLEVSQYLIDKGANVNAIGGDNRTILQAAAHTSSLEMVRCLVEKGADVNKYGEDKWTILQVAARQWSLEMVQYLVENGADVNKTGGKYETALQAATGRQSVEIVQYLVEKGADVNENRGINGTPLQAAASLGSLELVQYLVENGANVNLVGETWMAGTWDPCGTALQAAASSRSLEIVQYLVEKGADVNLLGRGTALQAAASSRSLEIVQYLVEHGADVNVFEAKRGTALQAAAQGSSLEIVRYLVEQGADTNLTRKDYGSALHGAASSRSLEVVRYLVEHGADVNLVERRRGTALQVAAVLLSLEVVQYLVEHGADVN